MAAGNAVIGALRVVLGLNSAALEKGLKSSQTSMRNWSATAGKIAAAAAAALTAATAGIGIAVRSTLKDMDKLAKDSQRIGIPVKQLAAFQHAAMLSGFESETFQKGMVRLANNSVQAAQGLQTYVRAFDALGINVKDASGQMKSVPDLLAEVAGKFSQMEKGTKKTALAVQIFGRAGAELIPMLNQGSAGIKAMLDEASVLGLVFEDQAGRAAEHFNDNMGRLGEVLKGVMVQFVSRILPTLVKLSDYLVNAAKNSGLVQRAADALTGAFNVVARAVKLLYDNFDLLKQAITYFIYFKIAQTAINGAIAFVKFAAAVKAAGVIMALFNVIRTLTAGGLRTLIVGLGAAGLAYAAFGDKVKSALEAMSSGAMKLSTDLLKKMGVDLSGLTADLDKFKAGLEKPPKGGVFDPSIVDAVAQNKALAEAKAAANKAEREHQRLVQEGIGIIEQSAPAWEQYQIEIQKTTLALDAAGATEEQRLRAMAKLAEQYGFTWNIIASSVAGSIGQIGDAFANESRSMAIVAKVAGIVQATIAMFVAGAKALAGPPFPLNIAAWAQVIAMGAGIVAQIRSVAVPKFAMGGSFRIPGAGGMDSSVVGMRVNPGEIIDIRQPQYGMQQMNGGSAFQASPREVTLRMVGVTREFARDMANKLNEITADGAVLKFRTA